MFGLGEYINWQPCPYPEIVDAFSSIDPPPTPAIIQDLPCPCSQGLGIFDAGLNFDQWGWAEWAAVATGAYFAISLFQDSSRGVKRVRRAVRRRAA